MKPFAHVPTRRCGKRQQQPWKFWEKEAKKGGKKKQRICTSTARTRTHADVQLEVSGRGAVKKSGALRQPHPRSWDFRCRGEPSGPSPPSLLLRRRPEGRSIAGLGLSLISISNPLGCGGVGKGDPRCQNDVK